MNTEPNTKHDTTPCGCPVGQSVLPPTFNTDPIVEFDFEEPDTAPMTFAIDLANSNLDED
jgi:hypothetical protein